VKHVNNLFSSFYAGWSRVEKGSREAQPPHPRVQSVRDEATKPTQTQQDAALENSFPASDPVATY
jgi:hypothetical protein